MRNWNYQYSTYRLTSYGFYSTYEELKPRPVWTYTENQKGFYSTYEELKQAIGREIKNKKGEFLQYLWGIETIYLRYVKKIKRKVFTVPMRNWNINVFSTKVFYGYVFTVPMRNWNYSATLRERKQSTFLQYLWGIETHKLSFLLSSHPRFLQYLWGIETFFLVTIPGKEVIVFTVPMRNWNDVSPPNCLIAEAVFTVPMRNWNTTIYFDNFSLVDGFYSTYEELKQRVIQCFLSYIESFYSTYEELKRKSGLYKIGLNSWFLQYLWGIETWYT